MKMVLSQSTAIIASTDSNDTGIAAYGLNRRAHSSRDRLRIQSVDYNLQHKVSIRGTSESGTRVLMVGQNCSFVDATSP